MHYTNMTCDLYSIVFRKSISGQHYSGFSARVQSNTEAQKCTRTIVQSMLPYLFLIRQHGGQSRQDLPAECASSLTNVIDERPGVLRGRLRYGNGLLISHTLPSLARGSYGENSSTIKPFRKLFLFCQSASMKVLKARMCCLSLICFCFVFRRWRET